MSLRYLLLNQLRSLVQADYMVTGISSPGPNVSVLTDAGIPHIAVPMSRNFTPVADLVSLWRLVVVFRRERFTIVHTHNPKPGLLGQLAARMAGVPIVINTLHGFYFHDETDLPTRRFYLAMEKIAARCSDSILSQNREDISTAIREGICKPEKIKYLGNGIDLERFDPAAGSPNQRTEMRAQLGIAEGTPVVGFVGRLVREKGIIELFEAARQIKSQVPNVRFLIVGPIDSEKRDAITPELANEYGIGDTCIFTGLRLDMPALYQLMDVFVLPSHREGFPRAPMEASAMGIPCVVTDIRGCREVVANGQNGFLVPLGDSQRLGEAVVDLLTDPAKARRMGNEGRRLAFEQFDERKVFAKVKEEYLRLLQVKKLDEAGTGTRQVLESMTEPK